MSGFSIRPAEPRDIAAMTRIYAHAVRHGTASFEIDPPDESEMRRRFESLVGGGYPSLVAEKPAAGAAGEILGYAYAGPYRSRPAYRFTVEDSIYVGPNMQRRGIGRALLENLIVESKARGFRQMIAIIGDSAQTPSIARHAALSFRLVGTLEAVGFKFDRWLDTVLMHLALGGGA
jgi:phosphinothricin acetyltransferase